MQKLKKRNVYHDFSETSFWKYMKMSRQEVSTTCSKTQNLKSYILYRQTLHDGRLYEVGGRVD